MKVIQKSQTILIKLNLGKISRMVNLHHQMRTIKKYWAVQLTVTMTRKKIKMTTITTKLFQIVIQMMMMMRKKKQIILLMRQTVKKKMGVLTKMMQMRLQITFWLERTRITKSFLVSKYKKQILKSHNHQKSIIQTLLTGKFQNKSRRRWIQILFWLIMND